MKVDTLWRHKRTASLGSRVLADGGYKKSRIGRIQRFRVGSDRSGGREIGDVEANPIDRRDPHYTLDVTPSLVRRAYPDIIFGV